MAPDTSSRSSLIDRNTRRSRNFVVDDLKMGTVAPIIRANIAKEATG